MHAWWHSLRIFVQLLSVLSFIDHVSLTNEQPKWKASNSTNLEMSNSTHLDEFENSSMTSLEEKEFENEETTIFSEIVTEAPDDSTTDLSIIPESTEMNREFWKKPNYASEIDGNYVTKVPTNQFHDLRDLENVIDTSDDSAIDSDLKHRNHFLKKKGESSTEPECKVKPPTKPDRSVNQVRKRKENLNPGDFEGRPFADSTPTDEGMQVTDLGIIATTQNTIEVSWKPPNGTLDVEHYYVQWFVKKSDIKEASCIVRTKADVHTIVITTEKSCTSYTVKVTPYWAHVNGSERVVTGYTGLDFDKDPLGLLIAGSTTDSLQISWSLPETDCVGGYLVNVCEGEICTEQKVDVTVYNKTELSPCTTYTFNVTVLQVESAGAYGSVLINGTTEFLKPGKPSRAQTISGNHSLLVSWEKPVGHTCADYYRVVWKSYDGLSDTINATNNETKIEKLPPCFKCKIEISAVWNGTDSEKETISSEMTAPNVTEPPTLVTRPLIDKTEIWFGWLLFIDSHNGCSDILLTVTCTVERNQGEGYEPVNGSTTIHIPRENVHRLLSTTVQNLSPFTIYRCDSYTYNDGGRSPDNDSRLLVETRQDVPSAPKLLPASKIEVTNTTIALQWERPSKIPGILISYHISFAWSYQFHVPSGCNATSLKEDIEIKNGSLTSLLYNAFPLTKYRIRIDAATEAGWGESSLIESYITKPGRPSQVSDLRHMMEESSLSPDILDVTIMWGMPCFANSAQIKSFNVSGSGKRNGFEDHNFSYTVFNSNTSCPNKTCALMIDDLREEHTYKIEVTTKVVDFPHPGEVAEHFIAFPAGIPPPPDDNYTNLISVDAFKARRTTTTATLLLPIFPDMAGTIHSYAIIVSKAGYNNASFGRVSNDSTWPHISSWIESKNKNFEIPYQAIKFYTDRDPTYITNYGGLKAVKFTLGDNTETCPEMSLNKDERSYCNGPLNPDTWYHVRMRAFTAGGYRDSVVFTVKTNAELQVALVVGTIFGILFLGILTTMMLLVRKGSLQAVLRRFLHSDMPGSPVPAPFTRRKFITHCQQLADNPGKLSNEYQLLQTLSVDLQMPTNSACLQANRKKNRYTDILPYDFSRVKLEVIDNDPTTDYINASFIKGFNGEEDYIACQGPKEETTYDFWRMIDQYHVKIIVMLTQLVEKNKEKCHQYFPTIRETFTYENMAIRCTSELDYRTYTYRTLILQKENEKRMIIHLHFKDWPDHDVPEDFDPMINFCQIMRRHMEMNRGLVVVHCSAGIGRTGTLIAIDILLQHIKDNRKLDVFGTVYRLRHHRINMVQRESQYAYIYNCIKQVLRNPYFSKTYKPPSVDPILDSNSHKKKEASDSSTNLVSSLETLKKSSFSTSVESAEPISRRKSNPTSKSCYPFNGLRYAKSTGAIDTRPCQPLIGRYNTHDQPISEIVVDQIEMKNSDISFEISESEGSTTSLYENMQPLLRSKSAHVLGRDDDLSISQKLLEVDTSL